MINGKPISLYKLYNAVISKGGWIKVSSQDRWNEIVDELGYSSENILMIENGIKLVYMRYLSKYEESVTGQEVDDNDSDIYGAKSKAKAFYNFANGDCPVSLMYRGLTFVSFLPFSSAFRR